MCHRGCLLDDPTDLQRTIPLVTRLASSNKDPGSDKIAAIGKGLLQDTMHMGTKCVML